MDREVTVERRTSVGKGHEPCVLTSGDGRLCLEDVGDPVAESLPLGSSTVRPEASRNEFSSHWTANGSRNFTITKRASCVRRKPELEFSSACALLVAVTESMTRTKNTEHRTRKRTVDKCHTPFWERPGVWRVVSVRWVLG
jgi:hypothetical protein